MESEPVTLPAIPLPGLSPDSLGHYLASLGLFRLLSRKWPSVRIGWHEDVLHLVGGPSNLAELLDEVGRIAERRDWTPYERGWAEAQKLSTKAKSGRALALWQAHAEEDQLDMLVAHAVPAARVSFNPLLGSGGNAGKRAFSDGWKQAVDALTPPPLRKPGRSETEGKRSSRQEGDKGRARDEARRKRAELEALLLGNPLNWMLEKINAASWFSDANKLYNSGQAPFREGVISPWSMALACEGLVFWAGGASRRLGARARAAGAFPFVTSAAAPPVAGEAGRDLGEVWVPLWERPMTLTETRALFGRGRAEVAGRGVLTPSAFATAILRRGVDAGITGFLRFSLGRTTSTNTFEPHFDGRHQLPTPTDPTPRSGSSMTSVSTAIERILALIDRLPADRKRFVGLRGPIETAMLRLAAAPDDAEAAHAVLDAAVGSLDRVDRNRSFRKGRVSWEPLPLEWLPSLFRDEAPTVEARLAIAIVSAFPVTRPFALYRFGVEIKHRRFEHPESPPARWVFAGGPLPQSLSAVLRRRTLDWESMTRAQQSDEEPVRLTIPVAVAHVKQWLDSTIDEDLLARWLGRLALFNWRYARTVGSQITRPVAERPVVDAAICLFGLLHPLLDQQPVSRRGSQHNLLDPRNGARTPGAARSLVTLVAAGQIDSAVRLAASRYAMAGAPLARTNTLWSVGDPERLLASMLFPIANHQRTALIERWLRPQRLQGDEFHV